MTPANWNDRRPASQPPRNGSGRVRQIGWASVPIVTIGFLSCAPFLAYAVMQRTKRDWAVFAAYLAATVAVIVALGSVNSDSSADGALGGFIIALAGCAAAHAAVLFRPRSGEPASGAQQRNRQAVEEARDRIGRRKDARHLIQTNPALARDLRIGRPDLPREYDDGGLVDVNHVPGAVLAAQLGLAPQEVTDVLTARSKLGRFASADELCAYTELPPDRVDELRDLMIFT